MSNHGLSRDWSSLMIKAHAAQSPERPWPEVSDEYIARYRANRKEDFESHILKLHQPVLCKSLLINDIIEFVVDGKLLRIYPPFPLDERKALSVEFRGPRIPEGSKKIERYVGMPDSAVGGLSWRPDTDDVFFCQGLRVDCQTSAPERKIIGLLIENIAQFTHQWWLRSGSSPFNGLGRFGAEINQDFSLREELRHAGTSASESTWYGLRQTQSMLGIERPLDNNLWLISFHHASLGHRADAGFLSFYDAIAAYMAFDDPTCIFRLSNCIEILGNKRRILRGLKTCNKESELLTKTDLVDETTRKILRKLFIDRDHIAHGREVHLLGRTGEPTIEDYVEAVRTLLSSYLQNLEPGQWPEASQLSIKRK